MANRCGSRMILQVTIIGAFLLFTNSFQLFAATNSLSGEVQSRYSDNSRLVSSNKESDVENRITVDFRHENAGPRCRSGADVSLGYGEWINETFDPEVYTNGALNGACSISESVQWRASNVISQQSENSREVDTPSNRTRKNVFSTGPIYSLQISPVDLLSLSASYVNTEFDEEEDPDSNRIIGTASYFHSFNATFRGGLSGTVERTELDTEEELDKESLTFDFDKSWAVTAMNGSFGINRLTSRLGQQEVEADGFAANVGIDHQINPTTSVALNARRELTDQTSTLGVDFDDFSFNLSDTSAVEVTAVSVRLNKRFSGGSDVSTKIFADRSDFVRSGNREESIGFGLSYARVISPLTSFVFDSDYRLNSYTVDDSEESEISLSIGLRYRLSPRMTFNSAVGHDREDSDVAGREYKENWVSLSLSYKFF